MANYILPSDVPDMVTASAPIKASEMDHHQKAIVDVVTTAAKELGFSDTLIFANHAMLFLKSLMRHADMDSEITAALNELKSKCLIAESLEEYLDIDEFSEAEELFNNISQIFDSFDEYERKEIAQVFENREQAARRALERIEVIEAHLDTVKSDLDAAMN